MLSILNNKIGLASNIFNYNTACELGITFWNQEESLHLILNMISGNKSNIITKKKYAG